MIPIIKKMYRVFSPEGFKKCIIECSEYGDDWMFNCQSIITALYNAGLIKSNNVAEYSLDDMNGSTIVVSAADESGFPEYKLYDLLEV